MTVALFGRRNTESTAPPRAVTAAAMPLVGPDVPRANRARQRETTEGWQKDAWYFYDAVGELRSPVTFLANACSQAIPFAAEVDRDTQLVTGPTENDTVQRIAAAVLGGAAHRAQLVQTITVCWQVSGELFVVIRPRAARSGVPVPDEWLVLSGSKVSVSGDSWEYTDPNTLRPVQLGRQDRLIRVWSPHPNDQARADTAVRPALPILREIEKSSMNIAAKLDSRLASNGILPWPQEAEFPPGKNADGTAMSQAASVATYLMEAMTAGLSNPGTAGAQAPIVVTMPTELIDTFSKGWMDLSSVLDSQVVDLRDNALQRLFRTLDMPKDVAEGSQGDANHWGAWQIEELTYKIYSEPLLQRIADALTTHWFRPALVAAKVPDPEIYVLDWDTSAIVKRPDATEDLNYLYENRLISGDYRREQSGIPESAVPTDEEIQNRILVSAVLASPALLEDPAVAEATVGFELEAAPEPESAPAAVPALPADTTGQRALPATQDDIPAGLVAAAELVAIDAFNRIGGRLLTASNRGQFADTQRHDLHTVIRVPDGDHGRLTAGSFQMVPRVAEVLGVPPEALRSALSTYVSAQLWAQRPHDPAIMTRYLREALR